MNSIVHTNKGIKMERIRLEISKIGLSKLARLKLIKPLKDDQNTLYEKTDKTIKLLQSRIQQRIKNHHFNTFTIELR